MKSKVTIIAEIGENHLGDIELAKHMIADAADAGADIVKFQSYNEACLKKSDPEYDWFCKAALSDKDHFVLKKECEDCGVEFLSSPFSVERAKFLVDEAGLTKLKVASAMLYNEKLRSFLEDYISVISYLYVSTGSAFVDNIEEFVCDLYMDQVCLMHCVSLYPCRAENANLAAIRDMVAEFELEHDFGVDAIGYSDHTVGVVAPIMAVALGATVIEKHFTFDRHCSEGTDHVLSLEPKQFKTMVKAIRTAEQMLGSGNKEPCAGELEMFDFFSTRFVY